MNTGVWGSQVCAVMHLAISYMTVPEKYDYLLSLQIESTRRRRHLFLLSLENPYSDYFQIFAVCKLALGNLPGEFFLRFSVSSTKSRMATKIPWRTLELEQLHRFVSCLV